MVYICEIETGETLSEEEEISARDLVDFKGGKDEISSCQVGKEEMRLSKSLKSSEKSSDKQGVLIEEENQRCIPIMGGIRILLPSSPVKASEHVESAEEGRQPTKTIMKEKEHTLTYSQVVKGEEDNSDKMITHSDEKLKLLEDWLSDPVTKEDFQKETVMQSEEELHPKEQLDGAGFVPAQGEIEELEEAKLSEKMAEHRLSNMAAEFEPAEE